MSDDPMDGASRGGRAAGVAQAVGGPVDCPATDDAHPYEESKVVSIDSLETAHWGLFPENRQHFLDAAKAFANAERLLKLVEFDALGFPLYIPPVNELRYYGFHINKAFACESIDEQREELRKAERHCRRSAFDAVEMCLLVHMDVIQLFQNDYRKAVITDVVPGYAEMCAEATRARDFIETHSHEQRADYYDECLPLAERLKDIARTLEFSRGSLNARRRGAFGNIIIAIVSTLLLSVAAFTGLVQADIVKLQSASTDEAKPTVDELRVAAPDKKDKSDSATAKSPAPTLAK